MKFSTRTTYGLRALVSLGKSWPKRLPLSQIAQEEDISPKYLERIFATLKKAGVVKAEIGAGGGYVLTSDPGRIDLWSVVSALEGNVVIFNCREQQGQPNCRGACACGAASVLGRIQAKLKVLLSEMSLADII